MTIEIVKPIVSNNSVNWDWNLDCDCDTAVFLNNIFSIKKLEVLKFDEFDLTIKNMKYSVFNLILKRQWHANIFVIEASIEGI